MNFVCLSDIHLSSENPEARLDDLVEVQFGKFEFALRYAKEHGAPILHAGDLCHKPRSWFVLPQLIDLLKKYQVPFYSIRGQHDDYMYSEETKDRTTLGILVKAGLITRLDTEKGMVVQDTCLFGANFGQKLAKVQRRGFTVGVIHASISNTALWPGHQYTDAAKFLDDNPDYDFILVGDIHQQFYVEAQGGRCLLNVGPMLRREATEYNYGHEPSLYFLDTENPKKCKRVTIPHAKAEAVLSRDHIDRKTEAEDLLDDFVREMKEIHPEMEGSGVSFVENMLKFAQENNFDEGVMKVLSRFMEKTKWEGL